MIDPVETVIAYLHLDGPLAEIVSSRVANKHRYGDTTQGWTHGQAAIAVRQEAGAPDLYRPVVVARLEIRCYANSPHEAMAIWLRLGDIARETERVVVQTTEGRAMLYYLVARPALTQIRDAEIEMDAALGIFDAMVYREALS